jgi:hypothetical protein
MACWCFLDKMTPGIENQGKDAKWHNKARGQTLHDAWHDTRGNDAQGKTWHNALSEDAWHDNQGNARHDSWQGKDGNKAGDNRKDENRVFYPGGNPQLAEFASMADAGKAALCLRSLP